MFHPNRICFVFKISFFILCVLTALALPPAHAAEVVLSWENPDDSRVDGYYIYWGPEGYSPDPNQPDTTINDPDATKYTITGLSPSTDYQVSATSFDSDTDPETISAFSETVSFTTAAADQSDEDGGGGSSGGCFISSIID